MLPQLPVSRDDAVAFLIQFPVVFQMLKEGGNEGVEGLKAWLKQLPEDEAAVAVSSFGAFIDPVDLAALADEMADVLAELTGQAAI